MTWPWSLIGDVSFGGSVVEVQGHCTNKITPPQYCVNKVESKT